MQQVIIGAMMVFMVLGALDKALLGGRFGYGAEFEKGIHPMGELTLMMAGIMCIALVFAFATPATAVLGDHLGYVFAVYPEGVVPMMIGKLAAGTAALVMALVLERKPE